MTIRTVPCTGPYRVHKAERARPRRSHASFDAAKTEAHRLAAAQPGDAFVIVQQVAEIACTEGDHG
jgi:hypothetical protein